MSYRPSQSLLANRTILVTGASAGIGRVVATTFASYGANVLLLGRDRKRLEEVSDDISVSSATPLIIPFDLLTLNSQNEQDIATQIFDQVQQLDGILHNASLLGPKVPIANYPPKEWNEVLHVNATAGFLLTRMLLPLLEKSEDASIVFTSSGVGRQDKGRAHWGAYAVSKFATEGLMEVLADELELSNIRVNSLNPGGTRTSMRAQAYPMEDPQTLPEPEAHMGLYLYLMGPDSQGVNGKRFDAQTWSGP